MLSLYIFIVGFLWVACPAQADDHDNKSPVFSIFESHTHFQDELNGRAHIHPNVRLFYERMNDEPVWFINGHLTNLGKIAIDVLRTADLEGLNPSDYKDAIHPAESPEQWIDSEILLTTRFLQFIDDVQIGRIDPMKISPDIKFHSSKTHAVELLADALNDKNSQGIKLRQMAPRLPQYIELKKALAEYRHQATDRTYWPVLRISKSLKMGDRDAEVEVLREILFLHGNLSNDKRKSMNFDEAVAKALRTFQKCHSLESDGIAGAKTRELLNYPIEEKIKKIIVNMERLRWLPPDLGHRHIIVNVAGYVLYGFEDSQVTIMMPVIVGRPDRRTPLFYSKLKNVVLNPSWGVPQTIFINDKLPKIMKDRRYVERSKFTIFDSKGRPIHPDEADWVNEGKNYFLRQSPGRHNALGQIKFNIENPYTIYMHGTPDQHLFAKRARALSSGCIRLKKPTKLAHWVLKDDSHWSKGSIQKVITCGETQIVNSPEYIPVYFTYQTIWVNESNKGKRIHFSDDPYHMDAKMIKLLNLDG